jgi:hypothetical protein
LTTTCSFSSSSLERRTDRRSRPAHAVEHRDQRMNQ